MPSDQKTLDTLLNERKDVAQALAKAGVPEEHEGKKLNLGDRVEWLHGASFLNANGLRLQKERADQAESDRDDAKKLARENFEYGMNRDADIVKMERRLLAAHAALRAFIEVSLTKRDVGPTILQCGVCRLIGAHDAGCRVGIALKLVEDWP